jgi:hypothetical protein
MTANTSRHPVLTLKERTRALPITPAISKPEWVCRPCGATVELASNLAVDDIVRCGVCHARLGKRGAFELHPAGRIRARLVLR